MTAARRPLWKTQQIRSTKIVRLTGGEYVVRAYGRADDGTVFKIPSADYFTGDRQDARDTAAAMVAPKIVNAVPAADAPGFVVVVEKKIGETRETLDVDYDCGLDGCDHKNGVC